MLEIAIVLFALLSIANVVVMIVYLRKKQKLQSALLERDDIERQIAEQRKTLQELTDVLANRITESKKLDVEIEKKRVQSNAEKARYDELLQNLTSAQSTYSTLIEQAEQRYNEELEELKRKNQEEIDEANLMTQVAINKVNGQIDDCQKLYASLVASYQVANKESDARRHVQISLATREDIDFMLNYVSPRLKNPTIISKLIWSEYFQKPTNDMLDYVLPSRDCAGIYKITNDETKEAYIGRSVSVRKRLTDHIKSSLGIDTIADQHVHQVMREKGIWNFTFELIEECPREKLNEREKYYIEFFHTDQYGYNQKAGG